MGRIIIGVVINVDNFAPIHRTWRHIGANKRGGNPFELPPLIANLDAILTLSVVLLFLFQCLHDFVKVDLVQRIPHDLSFVACFTRILLFVFVEVSS